MTWKRKIPGEGACGPCCSWKEKFNQLWDRAIGCIVKINNITPDGDGKFEIRGGTGVQVTPISNGVEIINTGATPEDVVYSVNGELPDADGDVTIDTGVMTVNSTAPDADGEFTITAGSNITITPGTNSIEIAAAGSTPTAKLPIYIDGDGDIALKGWVIYDNTNWSALFDATAHTLQDTILVLKYGQTYCPVYLPVGLKLTDTTGTNLMSVIFDGVGSLPLLVFQSYLKDTYSNFLTASRIKVHPMKCYPTSTYGGDKNEYKIDTNLSTEYYNKLTSANWDTTTQGISIWIRG